MENDRITLLRQVANEIQQLCMDLFAAGAGRPIWPTEDEQDLPGLIDEVSPDGNPALYNWMNAVLGFIRLVYGIHTHALNPRIDYFNLEDGDEA